MFLKKMQVPLPDGKDQYSIIFWPKPRIREVYFFGVDLIFLEKHFR